VEATALLVMARIAPVCDVPTLTAPPVSSTS